MIVDAPQIAISRHRFLVDGEGVIIAFPIRGSLHSEEYILVDEV